MKNNKIKNYINILGKNAKVSTFMFPLWAIPYTIYNYYLSLYLMEKGLADNAIGNIMIAANISALFFSLIAGKVVDKLGRKKSLFIFDLISSVIPPLLFLLFPNYLFSLIAMALTGLNRIMSISYYLMMIEDESEENAVVSMNLFNLILLFSGFFTPLAGLVISKMGIVNGERLFLIISVISMTCLTVFRNRLISETETGKIIKENSKKNNESILVAYKKTFALMLKNKDLIRSVLINAIVSTYYATATTASLLFAPYFIDYLKLSTTAYSLIGGVYTAGTLAAFIFINPRLKKDNLKKFTLLFSLFSILGFTLLLGLSLNIIVISIGVLIISSSYGVLKTSSDSFIAISDAQENKTTLYSIAFLLSAILSVIVIKGTTFLYSLYPFSLFAISAILMIALALLTIKKGETY